MLLWNKLYKVYHLLQKTQLNFCHVAQKLWICRGRNLQYRPSLKINRNTGKNMRTKLPNFKNKNMNFLPELFQTKQIFSFVGPMGQLKCSMEWWNSTKMIKIQGQLFRVGKKIIACMSKNKCNEWLFYWFWILFWLFSVKLIINYITLKLI